MKLRAGAIVGLILAAVVAVPLLTSAQTAPIRIGCPIDLTGAFALFGEDMRRATELALKEINDAGGILGRRVEAVYVDTESEVQPTIDKVKDLVYNKKVDILIGTVSSACRDACVPILNDAKVILINGSSDEGGVAKRFQGIGARYLFLIGAVPEQYTKPYINWMIKNVGKRFYLIGMDYVWGRGEIASAKKFVLEQGGTVVGEEYTPVGTTDFAPVLNRVAAAKPDIFLNVMAGTDLIYLVKQFHEFGLKNMGITLSPMYIDESYFPAIEPAALKGIISSGYTMSIDTATNRNYLDRLRQMYGPDVVPSSMGPQQYHAIQYYKAAVERVQSVATADVIRGLEGLGIQGVFGPEWIRAEDHVVITPYVWIFRIDADVALPSTQWMKIVDKMLAPVPALQGNVFAGPGE